ncbi:MULTISPECIES: efflux RND transporter permease subunit [Pseudoalteromonas]|jgi:multidrug efflux pump subunit AcrB|uniref:Acriflavine resistance protein B n=1 Tax=Pseudoalteromonas tetraodonis TaxID=43659 RepID=A0ABD4EQL8_9GAMM|nr:MULTISPECIES: efflux RND transporter permease subunit [Pseudoalteromonas]KYL36628.1 acriflavine resistance protein B [Pseudoalteromonas spiralis]MDN3396327.1 efflux RND transporter permease subunit [Pseudoalteromonas sp. APC 3215]MDN3402950.1 efflux RND transporter permease subunit [Pseudoalteromonas sp. APC 3213]MDN3404089.1 efflux RND transporter permease subunit [Pseudoalteromonas sp. APC 3218]MDN3407989.1 efflux RND transporter permease subunit [Pseudoalteromonas sp. APC 3894]|tara:strand:- start:464 stop:3547 length:3084 start_codon:yes stop_codon:yes gene_type:complete
MIAWFTRNHVAANLLLISIVLGGLFSLSSKLPLEVFPSFVSDRINISVSLRGSTPEDAEKGVTIRIEEALQDLEGIKQISSRSSEGSSQVSVEVDTGYDERELLADIKSRVDAINTFPADAEKPVIGLIQRKREVIAVTVSSDYNEKETLEYAEQVRDELLRIPAITQVELSGVRNYELAIEVSQDTLRQYDLTLAQISSAIANSSSDISAGNLKTEGGDVLIRSKGQAYRKDEFASIVIKNQADGTIIRLSDIATINDDFEETPVRTRFNGKQAAFIDVYRIGPQSAIEVADAVKNYITSEQANLPQGFYLSYWDDDSEVVKSRIATLTSNALQGGILVLGLLTLFLRPAIAFWVFIGIPVSFMGAFMAMAAFGVTINVISLFGFILVLGIVVDDAIVTGENVYTHLKTAKSGEEAAIKGTQEVATPVTFGVLTTVAAFLPLGFIEGARGAIFAQIPVVVIPVLLFSLIESKFVLPAHLKYIKLRQQKGKGSKLEQLQQRFADGFEHAILKYYQPVLGLALRNKLATVSLFMGVFLIILTMITSGWTKFIFFPRIPSETVRVNLTFPAGTPFEVTNKYIIDMSDKARELQRKYQDEETGQSIILNILASTGGRGGAANSGSVRFEITPAEQRESDIGSRELVKEWRQLIGVIPGAESLTFRAEIGRSSNPIDIQLSGNSITTLQTVAEQIKQRLATYPSVFDIADSMSDGKEELQIELTEQGLALGLNRVDVSRQVRNSFFGVQVQRIQRGRDDVRVMVRLPIDERRSVADLKDILIQTPNGGRVPLSHVATLVPGQSPSTITRIDRYRTLNVSADVEKTDTNMTVLQADLKTYLDELVQQYPGVSHSLEGEAKEQRESFGSLLWGMVFVFFVIYGLLAIPFKSYLQPLVVMSIIPFGMIGAVIGHWIMTMELTIMSLLGMLALIGVVVNDSLVLVDFINKKRSEGLDLMEAVKTAGVARFRPVMLTSLTTFIGLMPLLFEKATQAQFLIPMAVSLGFGIIFATFITLLFVPVNYMLMERFQGWFK